jgi:hypothetical protein
MDKKIPVYSVSIKNQKEFGVDVVSLVDDPAIMVDFVAMNKQVELQFKQVADQMKLAGPLLIPEQLIYRNDKSGEYYLKWSAEVIKQTAERFNANLKQANINLMHEQGSTVEDTFILENWIVEDEQYDKSRAYGFNLPVGTWFAVVKVNNEKFWNEKIKTGEIRGFSIEAMVELVKQSQTKNKRMKKYKLMKDGKVLVKQNENAEAVTEDGSDIVVAADSIAVGESVDIVTDTLDIVSDWTGTAVVDGEEVVITDGVIEAIGGSEEAPAEEAEAPATETEQQEPMEAPAAAGVTAEEVQAMVAVYEERIGQLEERLAAVEALLNESRAAAAEMRVHVAQALNAEKVSDKKEGAKGNPIEALRQFRNKN